ncbi:hypothetical protein HDU98_001606 [Podochytrium sp. JEL0797]|nr:hypothetical protein HDU98_001606 [Podochytrium sp. JEL0797]
MAQNNASLAHALRLVKQPGWSASSSRRSSRSRRSRRSRSSSGSCSTQSYDTDGWMAETWPKQRVARDSGIELTPGILAQLFKIDKSKECFDCIGHMVPELFREPASWTEAVPQEIPPKPVKSFPDKVVTEIGKLASKTV